MMVFEFFYVLFVLFSLFGLGYFTHYIFQKIGNYYTYDELSSLYIECKFKNMILSRENFHQEVKIMRLNRELKELIDKYELLDSLKTVNKKGVKSL